MAGLWHLLYAWNGADLRDDEYLASRKNQTMREFPRIGKDKYDILINKRQYGGNGVALHSDETKRLLSYYKMYKIIFENYMA